MIIRGRTGGLYNADGFESIQVVADEQIEDKYYMILSRFVGNERVVMTLGEYSDPDEAVNDMDVLVSAFAQRLNIIELAIEEEET